MTDNEEINPLDSHMMGSNQEQSLVHTEQNETPINMVLEQSAPKEQFQESAGKKKSGFFRNRYGHPRAGFRMFFFILIGLLLFLGVLLVGSIIIPVVDTGGDLDSPSLAYLIFYTLLDAILLFTGLFLLAFFDKRPLKMLGLGFSFTDLHEFIIGSIWGFGHFVFVFVIIRLGGWVDVGPGVINKTWFLSALYYLLFFFIAAAFEELLLRGYLFQAFCEGTRNWMGIILFSLIFSVLHIWNPSFDWISSLNLFICGVIFSMVYLKTRSLWIVFGMHMAWNWTQGILFGVNVSGISFPMKFMSSTPRGPDFLSGGTFGVEASIIYSLTGIIFCWLILKTNWFKPSLNKATEWKHYPRGFRLDPKEQPEL